MVWLSAFMRTRLGQGIALAVLAVLGILGIKTKWQSDAVKDDRAKQDRKAHDRINEADIGIGATDAERRDRLRNMGDKWGGD